MSTATAVTYINDCNGTHLRRLLDRGRTTAGKSGLAVVSYSEMVPVDGDESRKRRSQRAPVVLPAQCRTEMGSFGTIEIMDRTAEGCRIFAKALPFRVGQRVKLKPENFQVLAGTVRWVEHDLAGIEFESPLYGPVVEHLQRQFGPLP